MTTTADRYDRLAADFAATVEAVPADRWEAQSPCEKWTARDLVAHVIESHGLFEGFVGRGLGDIPSTDDDPVAAFATARAVVSEHLHDPEAAEASFEGEVFGHTTFAEGIDRFLASDLLIHRWDLGKAAGLDVTLPADEVDRVRETMAGLGDMMRSSGAFGPEVAVPEDASPQDRLLGFLGRQP